MKISVITICYNNERDIRATIESVINQNYPDIEYIIKDGGSKDCTMSIVNEYGEKISKVISNADKGIYDAINQGICVATGEVIGLIHAGDRLYDNTVLEKIAKIYKEYPETQITFGHSKIYDRNGNLVRINKSPEYNRDLCRRGWFPSHQSIYSRREVFEKYGNYEIDVGWAADYQWFIKMFFVYSLNIRRIDEFLVKFSNGGVSTSNYKSRFTKRHRDMIRNCWLNNGVRPPHCIVGWQLSRKIKQVFMAMCEIIWGKTIH